MKKLLFITVLTFLTFNLSYATTGTGPATEYEVTMKKVELCSDSACATAVTVGERDMKAEIAAADAGAQVGNFSSTTGIPAGTYTHIQITMDRAIQVTGSVTTGNDGSAMTCFTDGGTDNVANNLLATAATAAVTTSMFLVNEDSYKVGTGDTSAENIPIVYSTPKYAASMSVSGSNAIMIYELADPYTRLLKAPVITVAFNTLNAVGCEDTTADVMWVDEPFVKISIQ